MSTKGIKNKKTGDAFFDDLEESENRKRTSSLAQGKKNPKRQEEEEEEEQDNQLSSEEEQEEQISKKKPVVNQGKKRQHSEESEEPKKKAQQQHGDSEKAKVSAEKSNEEDKAPPKKQKPLDIDAPVATHSNTMVVANQKQSNGTNAHRGDKNEEEEKKGPDDETIRKVTNILCQKLNVTAPRNPTLVDAKLYRNIYNSNQKIRDWVIALLFNFNPDTDFDADQSEKMKAFMKIDPVELFKAQLAPGAQVDPKLIPSLTMEHDLNKLSFTVHPYNRPGVTGHSVSFGEKKSEKYTSKFLITTQPGRIAFINQEPKQQKNDKGEIEWNDKFYCGMSFKLPAEYAALYPIQQANSTLSVIRFNVFCEKLLLHTWNNEDRRKKIWTDSFAAGIRKQAIESLKTGGNKNPTEDEIQAATTRTFLYGAKKIFKTDVIKGTTTEDTIMSVSRDLFSEMSDEEKSKLNPEEKPPKETLNRVKAKYWDGFTYRTPKIDDMKGIPLEHRDKEGKLSIKRGDVAYAKNVVVGIKNKGTGEYGIILRWLWWQGTELVRVESIESTEEDVVNYELNMDNTSNDSNDFSSFLD